MLPHLRMRPSVNSGLGRKRTAMFAGLWRIRTVALAGRNMEDPHRHHPACAKNRLTIANFRCTDSSSLLIIY